MIEFFNKKNRVNPDRMQQVLKSTERSRWGAMSDAAVLDELKRDQELRSELMHWADIVQRPRHSDDRIELDRVFETVQRLVNEKTDGQRGDTLTFGGVGNYVKELPFEKE